MLIDLLVPDTIKPKGVIFLDKPNVYDKGRFIAELFDADLSAFQDRYVHFAKADGKRWYTKKEIHDKLKEAGIVKDNLIGKLKSFLIRNLEIPINPVYFYKLREPRFDNKIDTPLYQLKIDFHTPVFRKFKTA